MDFKDLEILRKGNSELRKELEKVKEERDKTCKDYLELYARVEKTKEILDEKIRREIYRIEKSDGYILLEALSDFKQILDILERKD